MPWTHSRLAAASGYGAGITSPGWYHHLFTVPEQTIARWLTRVAGVLRGHDLPVSSAHIIEAVRLAETLAVLRGRPLAGLAEVSEATKSVLCDGDDLAAAFVTRDLVVGEALGAVPDGAPPVPLDADLRARARALKLKIEPLTRTLALDLRKETDRGRSVFLHRLGVLGIGWGEATADLVRGTGTFHETWTLRWRPELAVAIIDAALWGTTVDSAATAKIISVASPGRPPLAEVTRAVERVLLADLPEALEPVLRALDATAATESDVTRLMAAVPALVRAIRYGDVRGTATGALSAVVDALTVRVCAGLPAAAGGLADDAASVLRASLDGMHAALGLHAQGALGAQARDRWMTALVRARRAARRARPGRRAGRAAARRRRRAVTAGGGRAGSPPRCPSASRQRTRPVGRGLPVRQRPAARPRPRSARHPGRLAGLPVGAGVPRRAAAAAADVRRVRGARAVQHRAGGQAPVRRRRSPARRRRVLRRPRRRRRRRGRHRRRRAAGALRTVAMILAHARKELDDRRRSGTRRPACAGPFDR